MKATLLAILTLTACAASASGAVLSVAGNDTLVGNRPANLLTNGSFEADAGLATNYSYWATGTTLSPTMALSGWTAAGQVASYAIWGSDGLGGINGSASLPDGTNGLYFGGGIMASVVPFPTEATNGLVTFAFTPSILPKPTTGPVTLQQTVSGLTPAATYLLDFWTSGEDIGGPEFPVDGFFGLDITGEARLYFAAPSGNGPIGPSQRYQVYFTATASTLTFKWINWGHYNGPGGLSDELVLDDVILNKLSDPAGPVDCNCVANLPGLVTNGCPAFVPDLCALATNCFTTNMLPGSCLQNPPAGSPAGPGTNNISLVVMDTQSNMVICQVAFVVIAPPNPTLSLTCAPNKTVECGSGWMFDPPIINTTCCDPFMALNVVGDVTSGTCPKIITRTWLVTNACGLSASCSQTVTNVDTTPPTTLCSGVNLVPNGNFEFHTACPTSGGQLSLAAPWFPATDGTCEYYNSCAWSPYVSTPANGVGVQSPLSGQGYGGILVYGTDPNVPGSSYREYMEVPLVSSLVAGQTYRVSFYVSRAENYAAAIAEIGALFSSGPIISNGYTGVLNFLPQVVNPSTNLLLSTTAWMLVQGTFVAAGGESYLTLGNFLPDAGTTMVPASGLYSNVSYYYFDDVSVETLCPGSVTNKTVQCGSSWTFDSPTAFDQCSGTNVLVSIAGTVTNGPCPLAITRTWTLTDLCGNTNSWQQTVTVLNTNPPQVNCACLQDSALGLLNANACSGLVPNLCLFTNCFSSACGSLTATQAPPAGTILGPGTHTITVTVLNCSGGSATCEVPFTVNPALSVTCPPNLGLATCANTAVAFFNVTATGNTGPVVCSPPSGSAFPLGTNLVTCTATNDCGGIAACSFTVTVSGASCTPPPANMVMWLRFDETSGATAYNAAAGNHGSLAHSPAHNLGQYVANSLCFNGVNQYVQVTPYPAMQFGTNDFTVDAWVKPATLDNSIRVIVDHREENGSFVRGYSLFLGGGNTLGFQIADGTFTSYPFLSSVVPADGQWHFVAVTVQRNDPLGIKVYVDGVADPNPRDPTIHPGSVTAGPCYPFRVASRSSSVSGLFPGCVDEVELFRRSLTPAEIQAIYNARCRGKCRITCQPGGGTISPCAVGGVTNLLVINNPWSYAQTFNWSLIPLPLGTGCTKPGPTFSPSSGTITIPAWSAGLLATTVTLPNGFTYGDCSCYQMVVSLPDGTQQVTCPGSLCLPPQPGPVCATTTTLLATATNLDPAIVTFTLEGTGSAPTTLANPIVTLRSPENVVVSATPLATLTVPPAGGAPLQVPASFAFPDYDPGRVYSVALETDPDGTGQYTALSSMPVINVAPTTPADGPLTVQRGKGGTIIIAWPDPCAVLEVNPNPANPAGWVTGPVQTSPWVLTPSADQPATFIRLRR